MRKYRIYSLMVVLCLLMSLTACGSSGNTSGTPGTKKIEGTVKDNLSDGGEVNKAEKAQAVVSETVSQSTSVDTAQGTYNGYKFIADGTAVMLDDDINNVLDKLGETVSYYESVSCAFNGIDKIYTYPHFEIQTYPAEDGYDRISVIVLFDDMYETAEKITIGSTRAAVKNAYPECTEEGTNQLFARKGADILQFILNAEDKVISVQYMSHVLDGAQN